MGKIAVEGMKFFAYHGFYDHEREYGNQFTIDVYVDTDLSKAITQDELDATLDYEALYSIVRQSMEHKYYLLEHLAGKIIASIHESFPAIEHVKVRVSKLNPPMKGEVQRVYIELERSFQV